MTALPTTIDPDLFSGPEVAVLLARLADAANRLQAEVGNLKTRCAVLERDLDSVLTTRQFFATGETRALDTPFIIHPSYSALVWYVVKLETTAPLTVVQNAKVELKIDGVIADTYKTGFSQLAGLLASIHSEITTMIPAWIPPGATVELVSSGAGLSVLVSSVEVVFVG